MTNTCKRRFQKSLQKLRDQAYAYFDTIEGFVPDSDDIIDYMHDQLRSTTPEEALSMYEYVTAGQCVEEE